MAARPGIRERATNNGRWKPPKALGNNVKLATPGQSTPIYYHDGQITTRVNELPENAEEYQIYSIYFEQAVFWTVDYDATEKQVEDGDERDRRQSSQENDSDSEELDDWKPVSFGEPEGNTTYLSYAGRHQQHRVLRMQRPDQLWATQLLTDIYQAPHSRRVDDVRFGGLVGDIALLIGIAAMSLPPAQVHRVLPVMLANPWRILPPERMPREAGWHDRRGLVVTVYNDPGETSEEDMASYESGQQGAILP